MKTNIILLKDYGVTKLTRLLKLSFLLVLGLLIISTTWKVNFISFKHRSFLYYPITVKYPKKHLAFLKIHKCASSTLQNIVMRYGDLHNCQFVLSCSDNYLTYDLPFNIRTLWKMPKTLDPKYDILAHHTIFSKEGFAEVMYDDAIYITILRNPVDVFESLYRFSHFERSYNRTIQEFIEWKEKPQGQIHSRVSRHLGRNQMLFILGFNSSEFDDFEKVISWIQFVNSTFDLVLIAERFDESLILLKHLMGWEIDDIVYITHNARQKRYISNLTYEEKAELRQYNIADQMLYDHFLGIFEQLITQFGKERMKKELRELHLAIERYRADCQFEISASDNISGETKPWSKEVYGYKVNTKRRAICHKMAMGELQFTRKLQRKQNIECKEKQ